MWGRDGSEEGGEGEGRGGGVFFVGEGWAGGCFKEMHHKCNQN